MKKKFIIGSLIVLTVALGFLRDYLFVSINYFIASGNDVTGNLNMLKWVLTFLFSLFYLLDTIAFLYLLFHNRKYMWLAVASYSFLFVVALFSALCGYLFSSFHAVYPFIRMVLGAAQSPVVAMVLIPACFLDNRLK